MVGFTIKWKKQYELKDEQRRDNEIMRITSYDGDLIDPDDRTLTTMNMDENRIDTSRRAYRSLIVVDDSSDNSLLTSSSDTDYFQDGIWDLSDTKMMIVSKKQSLIRRVLYVILVNN